MSENSNTPLNDFLAQMERAEDENNLFSVSLPSESEINQPLSGEPNPQEADQSASVLPERSPEPPSAVPDTPPVDPFTAALQKAQKKSEQRMAESLTERDAIFSYGKAKDPITDRESTFEDLRQKYETDFPELSDSKRVSWTIAYGKVSKSITNPGSDKVYILKSEIEKSKNFLDQIKKAKTESEKFPECIVKPRVTAQSKGEMQIPQYKDYCASLEDAQASDKPIIILPSRDGRIYEMRKNPIGTFTAPADFLPEFPIVEPGLKMSLPKIPVYLLTLTINFFRKLSHSYQVEALIHILYDTKYKRYILKVPKQEITHTSVYSVMAEDYPDDLIHVMDIHSHNIMPARFSAIDDRDETATRLYAVVGHLDRLYPDITVRASCGGKFISLNPEDVFEHDMQNPLYPEAWNQSITVMDDALPEHQAFPRKSRDFLKKWRRAE